MVEKDNLKNAFSPYVPKNGSAVVIGGIIGYELARAGLPTGYYLDSDGGVIVNENVQRHPLYEEMLKRAITTSSRRQALLSMDRAYMDYLNSDKLIGGDFALNFIDKLFPDRSAPARQTAKIYQFPCKGKSNAQD